MNNTKPAVFYFVFSLQNENPWIEGQPIEDSYDEDEDDGYGEVPSLMYGFNISAVGINNYLAKVGSTDFESAMSDFGGFEDFFHTVENEYGVHDFGSYPTDECYSVGYNTYEVPSVRIPELMTKWRDYFIGLVGNEVTEVVQLTQEEDGDLGGSDFDTYKLIEKKLSKGSAPKI